MDEVLILWWRDGSIPVPKTDLLFLSASQAQYSHHVIQEILGHLDFHKRDSPRVRAGIIQVLLEAVAIAAKGSIGKLDWVARKPLSFCVKPCWERKWGTYNWVGSTLGLFFQTEMSFALLLVICCCSKVWPVLRWLEGGCDGCWEG